MASEWQKVKLGDIITLRRGFDLPARERMPGKVPVVSSSGISDYHSEAKVKGPGVITGRYGTIGSVYFCEEDYWPHNTTLFVEDFKGNYPRFIYYLLQTLDFLKYSDKAAVPGVNRNHLHTAEITIPDIKTQQEITKLLSAFDNRIVLNRKMNATLAQMAQALFKSWFVDFDPVKANATGNSSDGLDADTSSLFPSEFEENSLGELIPKGWQTSTIGEEVEVLGGSTPSTKEPLFWDGGVYHWVTPRDLSRLSDKVLLDTDRKITDAGLQQISSGQLPIGTVLLSSRAPIGYLALSQIPISINQGFIAMVCNKRLSQNYVLHWAEHSMSKIEERASGTTFAEISKSNFRPIPVIVPSREVIRRFDDLVTPIYQQIAEKVKENTTLSQLRDELLPKLISGKLRFADLDT